MKLKPIAAYVAVERPRLASCEICHGKDSWLKCVCMVADWEEVPADNLLALEITVKD